MFVPSAKQSQLSALSILTLAAADNSGALGAARFRRGSAEELDRVARSLRDETLTYCVSLGVGFLHDGVPKEDQQAVLAAFNDGRVGVIVAAAECAWSLGGTKSHTVVIADTQRYDSTIRGWADYPLPLMLHMVGRAGRTGIDEDGACAVLCAASRRDSLRSFLFEPLPVESLLDQELEEHLNAAVAEDRVRSTHLAMEWTSWTLLSRRLRKNPNFYNAAGKSARHLSDHVSELIEGSLKELSETRCVALADDAAIARGWVDAAGRVQLPRDSGLSADDVEDLVEPLNLGLVAAYYGIRHTTMEVMHVALSARTRLKGLLEILSASHECKAVCALRRSEEWQLRRAAAHLPLSMPKEAAYDNPATKANILF